MTCKIQKDREEANSCTEETDSGVLCVISQSLSTTKELKIGIFGQQSKHICIYEHILNNFNNRKSF